ncbi:MAG TPA: anthrone oxygenase family protein [Actinophytocola sp.]|uniref:anthrone oxygenase family protein n=1 Tax=Actinophytocola sp. TaxID=1872138 RepID=UPI002DB7FB21|nr:anthrone oxygenase family protein [Actinophytocola sp.]HEU5473745.1 anthrone oxygenase family protein [Actinophytocola sp.]
MTDFVLVLTFAATLGCGLGAGVFFAFSSFVMPGLRRLPAPQGIAAMQSINVTAVTPVFMIQLFGTAVLCAVLVVLGALRWAQPGSVLLVLGGLAYLLGAIVLTAGYHVPRNNALNALDPGTPEAAEYWARHLREWTRGNHVRALASTAACGLLAAALRIG